MYPMLILLVLLGAFAGIIAYINARTPTVKRPRALLPALRLFVTCAPGNQETGGVLTYRGPIFNGAPALFPLPVQVPTALVHDSNGALYVAAGYPDSAVLVYSPNANAGDPPMRRIKAGLINPSGICLDAQEKNLYVADAGLTGHGVADRPSAVYKFSPDADGAAQPITTFTLPEKAIASGVAVDGKGTVLVASGRSVGGAAGGLFVYPPGQNANPIKVLAGFGNPQQLAFDWDGDLYMTSDNPERLITVFPPPYQNFNRVITSPVFQDPYGVAVDGKGQIYVADRGAATVFVFDRAAGQGAQPLQSIVLSPAVPYGLDWSPFP